MEHAKTELVKSLAGPQKKTEAPFQATRLSAHGDPWLSVTTLRWVWLYSEKYKLANYLSKVNK
jgi:hypothetical protein